MANNVCDNFNAVRIVIVADENARRIVHLSRLIDADIFDVSLHLH